MSQKSRYSDAWKCGNVKILRAHFKKIKLCKKVAKKFAKHNLFIVSLQCLSDNNQCITSHLPFIRVYISFASLTSL